ncbi:MAG: DUF116 domain-containing protein [Halobacteriota archaeon]|nr:DUF116 domain-containing protein [Halobacteriota archaeon]
MSKQTIKKQISMAISITLTEDSHIEEDEVNFLNTLELQKFKKTSYTDRVLFLPHCLRRIPECKGEYSESGFNCTFCNDECPISELKTFAEDLGYAILVVPGGSMIKRYLGENEPSGVVGVACFDELMQGMTLVRNLNGKTAIQMVLLSKDGCTLTEVDTERVKKVLLARSENIEEDAKG